MIVKCEQCQTRFKIPDDKVTDKGVKVRCTKCSHTFRVTRDMADPGTAPVGAAPPAGDDPFARFGAPAAAQAGATVPNAPNPFAPPDPGFGLGAPAASPMSVTGLPPGHKTSPGMPAPLPSAPNPVARTAGAFDFAALAPPPAVSPLAAAAPPPPAAGASPFDFSSLVPPARTSPPAAPMPPQQAAPFDFSALGPLPNVAPAVQAPPPPPSRPPPPPPPSNPTAATAQVPAFDFSSLGAPPAAAAPAPMADPFGAIAAPGGGNPFGALESPPPADPFGSAPPDLANPFGPPASAPRPADPFAPSAAVAATASMSTADARTALFDMSTASTSQQPALASAPSVLPDVEDPLAVPAAPAAPVVVARMSPPVQPRPVAPEAEQRPRRAVGIVVNLAIAAVLVVALFVTFSVVANEGKFDSSSLSVERLKALFADPSEYVAGDVSNGLYETRSGRAVFFVRGEVTNTGATNRKVKVRAEILEGGSLVRAVEGYAGPAPSPEELRGLDSPDELERLLAQQAARAQPVAPGTSAPFVVAFFEYPPDLKAFRIRVAASGEAGGDAAAKPADPKDAAPKGGAAAP